MNIHDMALQFAEALKSSNEYRNLKKAKKIIDSNSMFKNRIEEFKKKHQEIFSAEWQKSFEELLKIPEINHYIKCEKEFSMMTQQAYKTVTNALDADLR